MFIADVYSFGCLRLEILAQRTQSLHKIKYLDAELSITESWSYGLYSSLKEGSVIGQGSSDTTTLPSVCAVVVSGVIMPLHWRNDPGEDALLAERQ